MVSELLRTSGSSFGLAVTENRRPDKVVETQLPTHDDQAYTPLEFIKELVRFSKGQARRGLVLIIYPLKLPTLSPDPPPSTPNSFELLYERIEREVAEREEAKREEAEREAEEIISEYFGHSDEESLRAG